MMKFVTLLSVCLLLSVNAFAPASVNSRAAIALRAQSTDMDDAAILSRRDAMRQGATAAMTSLAFASVLAATPETALADIYDDQEKERKLKQKADNEKNKGLVPKILFGGVALSLPFFLPNVLRLGKKLL